MVDILSETQLQRDEELAAYTGRNLKDIQSLRIGAPESLRIHDETDNRSPSFDSLYVAYPLMDEVHYLRTLAALTVTRRARYLRQLQKHISLDHKRVLDFGCGVGSHGIFCVQQGAQVDFLDVDGPLRQFAQWRVRQRRLEATFLDVSASLPEAFYNVVLCLDVLEHLAHPIEALWRITRSLKQGGLLVLEVSTMVKPTSGHFSVSIDKWKQSGPRFLREAYRRLGGVLHAKS